MQEMDNPQATRYKRTIWEELETLSKNYPVESGYDE